MTASDTALPTLAVLLTVHDRRELTLTCLERLSQQTDPGCRITVYLTDDGSTDGTGEAVRERFPEVVVIEGTGDLWYTGGMRLAYARAMRDEPDWYLFLNDDTHLDDDAIGRLLAQGTALRDPATPVCVVATVRVPGSEELSYGGQVRPDPRRPLAFELVPPEDVPVRAETFNANCVLIDRAVTDRIGNMDGVFVHSMGDFDYGLRAVEAGCDVWVAPGTFGECEPNPGFVPRPDAPVRAELARLRTRRFLPPREWRAFVQRYAGPLWPVYFASPAVRTAVRLLARRIRR